MAELKTKKSSSTYAKGREGEDKAAEYLSSCSLTIVARNFRNRGGEIDIIALDGDSLVFVEVKSLPNGDIDTLASELGPRKRQKILRTAKYYLLEHPEYANFLVRFDIIALDVPGLEEIHHIRGAFNESGLL